VTCAAIWIDCDFPQLFGKGPDAPLHGLRRLSGNRSKKQKSPAIPSEDT
jgi:hypothetical protein